MDLLNQPYRHQLKCNFRFILALSFLLCSCQDLSKKEEQEVQEEKTEISNGIDDMGHDSEYPYDILNDWLQLGIPQAKVIEMLGEPTKKDKDEYWGATDTYVQKWHFNDIGLKLHMESEKEGGLKQVFSITAHAPNTMKTSKNARIGIKKEKLISLYADHYNIELQHENSIIIGSIYGGVIYTIENGLVSEIFIGAAAE